MLEAALSKKIIARLRAEGCWATKIVGGPRQAAGLPDIIACYRGRFVAFEVKRPGREGTLTAIQRATLDAIRESSGKAWMITSVKDAMKILAEIDEELDRRY